jgi:hypothetical protein
VGVLEFDICRGKDKSLYALFFTGNSSPSVQVREHPVKENSGEIPGKVILSKAPETEVCIVQSLPFGACLL